MRHPKPKAVDRLAPELVASAFPRMIRQEYEERLFGEPGRCPKCGSEKCWRVGVISRIFCRTIEAAGFHDVKVRVRRFRCTDCGYVRDAQSPFYPGCYYGAPVVDFCLLLASKNPYQRVERILMTFGLQVDEDTVNNYAVRFQKKVRQMAGVKMFDADMVVNFIQLFFGVDTARELKKKYPGIRVEALADETYPARKGAKKEMREANRQREFEGKKPVPYPEGWTTASTYLPSQKTFGSLLVSLAPFSGLLARPLLAPLQGVDYLLTDGHGGYNIMPHERDLVHRLRNWARRNPSLKARPPDERRALLREKYAAMKAEQEASMKDRFPQYGEDGAFQGALTTNAMEGGNWRIKFELRACYANLDAFAARCTLIAIRDSMANFRGGEPETSFVFENSDFSFRRVMEWKAGKTPQGGEGDPGFRQMLEEARSTMGGLFAMG